MGVCVSVDKYTPRSQVSGYSDVDADFGGYSKSRQWLFSIPPLFLAQEMQFLKATYVIDLKAVVQVDIMACNASESPATEKKTPTTRVRYDLQKKFLPRHRITARSTKTPSNGHWQLVSDNIRDVYV